MININHLMQNPIPVMNNDEKEWCLTILQLDSSYKTNSNGVLHAQQYQVTIVSSP